MFVKENAHGKKTRRDFEVYKSQQIFITFTRFHFISEKITHQKVCFKLFEKASFLRSSHVRPKEKKTFVSALLARQKIILFNDVAGQCNVPCLFTLKLRYWEQFTLVLHALLSYSFDLLLFFCIPCIKECCDCTIFEIL